MPKVAKWKYRYIEENHNKGMPIKTIAMNTGLSLSGVYKVVKRFAQGKLPSDYTEEELAVGDFKVQQLEFKEYASARKIAQHIGFVYSGNIDDNKEQLEAESHMYNLCMFLFIGDTAEGIRRIAGSNGHLDADFIAALSHRNGALAKRSYQNILRMGNKVVINEVGIIGDMLREIEAELRMKAR